MSAPAGLPDRVTYRVTAIGSTDAMEKGKAACREAGYRIRTTCSVHLVTTGVPIATWRTQPLQWDVTLAVRL